MFALYAGGMPLRSSRVSALAALSLLLFSRQAFADNSPERAQRRVEESYLPKVRFACGIELSVTYDAASLRAHNQDIRYDQTDGELTCGEPLRYLWYACQSPAGQAAARAARIDRIVCKGTAAKVGTLALAGGALTVERAFEERDAHERLRKRFEALLELSLTFPPKADKDPYRDQAWNELQYEPNPTTSTTDYCSVNGKKREFDAHILNRSQGADAKVQCWKSGKPVIDMAFANNERTGFYTEWSPRGSRVFSYREGERHGEQKTFEGERLTDLTMYERGKIVWSKEFHASGQLKRYSRNVAGGSAGLSQAEDGKVYTLDCTAELGSDPVLRGPCGFEGPRTTSIYDGTEKLNRVETWKNGVLQEQRAGTSDYAERSNVKYAEGKRQGIERVLDEQGKLAATISWNRGVKDGKEIAYAEGGTKVIKETVWRAGVITQVTEFYLNGNPKRKELHDKPEHMQVEEYWDTGKIKRQGAYAACSRYGRWCEEGLHRSFFESGASSEEETYKQGQLHGARKSWWENGTLQAEESYAEGRCMKRKRWDQKGKLETDEEYEADGSRKLKR